MKLSPKALNADNLTRGLLEEIRDHNVVNVIEFKRREDDPQDEFPLPGMLCAVALGALIAGGAFGVACVLYKVAQVLWP